jgi:regulator of protease activity HflC (stomatin/prohibitin superfamily)
MVKKRNTPPSPNPGSTDKPATLKDLLNADIVSKLKAQADQMKAEEEERKLAIQKQEAEARKAEQKRLENDFEHLLNNSKLDWRKHK